MRVYLASPWFNEKEMEAYKQIINKMRSQGIEVYVPLEHEVKNAWDLSNADWGHKVFMADIDAIDSADEVWVVNHGMYSDTGTAWECGYAYAKGKVIRQLVYTTMKENVFSLMMINGCDEYDSVENYISDKNNDFEIEVK